MRASLIRSWGLGSTVLLATACNAILGIGTGESSTGGGTTGGGMTSSTTATGHGGTGGTGGAIEAGTGGYEGGTGGEHEAGTGAIEAGMEGGEPCGDAGSASCSDAVLTTCDGTGHTQVTTCAAKSLCDALNQRCSDYGRLGVGNERACIIGDDQTVWCWGGNYGSPGQGGASLVLGDTHRMTLAPTQIQTPQSQPLQARQVSVNYDYQCVLHDDGTVGCWGNSAYGAFGASTQQEYTWVDPVPNVTSAVEISVGGGSCVCARLANGDIDCWGPQDHGCTGTATTQTGPQPATKIPLPAPALGISAGDGYFTPICARLATGHVSCWSYYLPPTELPGITDAEDVVSGWGVVYVRTKTGLYWSTQLPPDPDAGTADGGPAPYTWMTAAPYTGFTTVAQVSTGAAFCALQTDGSVLCASANGGSPVAPSLVQVPTGKTAVEVGVGWGDNYGSSIQCMRTAGSSIKDNVYCWGDDHNGALGFGGPEYHATKVDVPSFSTHAITSMNAGAATIGVVLDDQSAWYWGHSTTYQGTYTPQTTPAVLLNLGKNNVALHSDDVVEYGYATKTAGASVALFENGTPLAGASRLQTYSSNNYVDARHGYVDFGLLPGGTVVAYSANQNGNANDCGLFGNGGTSIVSVPQAVPNLTAATLAYQDYGDCGSHVCVITTTGTVQCWGNNNSGQSGVAGSPSYGPVYSPTPVAISGASAITSLAVGADFTCATDGASGSGQVYCWGNNSYGQLGIDYTYSYDTATPSVVIGIKNGVGTSPAVGVTAFNQFACAWLEDGTVWCWGNNDFGQLGNGTFDAQPSPVQVTGISDAVSVTAGPDFACALRTGGAVSCWGSSYWGQGGTGVHGDNYPTPTAVVGLP